MDEVKGIFRRGNVYWYQPPMVRRTRAPMVSLETDDLHEAIKRAEEVRVNPSLAPSSNLVHEIRAHLKRKTQGKQPDYTRATADNKKWVLEKWAQLYPRNANLDDVTTDQLQAYYDEMIRIASVQTAHKHLMTIRALFNDALERKQVRRNPASAVKERDLPETARVRYCDRPLRDKLIRECPTEELQYVLMCGFHAGLRKNEIIESVPWWFNLTLRHIDLRSTPTLRFNDKKQARDIPMRNIMHEFLTVYGLREPFMLKPGVRRGKNIYRYDFAKPFRAYMQAQSVPWVTPHIMRHTFASLLVIDNCSIFKVAKWLGDSVIVTEKVYAHLAPSDPDIEEAESGSGSINNRSSA